MLHDSLISAVEAYGHDLTHIIQMHRLYNRYPRQTKIMWEYANSLLTQPSQFRTLNAEQQESVLELMLDGYHLLHFINIQGCDFNQALIEVKNIFYIKSLEQRDVVDQLPYISELQHFLKKRLEEAFLIACTLGSSKTVTELIASGVNVHCEDAKGRNAAHYVVMRRGELGKGLLLDIYQGHYQIPPTDKDMVACFTGRKAIIGQLLDHEVNFKKPNAAGNTATQLLELQKTAAKTAEEVKDFPYFTEMQLRLQNYTKAASKVPAPATISTTPAFSVLSAESSKASVPKEAVLNL